MDRMVGARPGQKKKGNRNTRNRNRTETLK